MAQFKTEQRSLFFEELEPRLLFPADMTEPLPPISTLLKSDRKVLRYSSWAKNSLDTTAMTTAGGRVVQVVYTSNKTGLAKRFKVLYLGPPRKEL